MCHYWIYPATAIFHVLKTLNAHSEKLWFLQLWCYSSGEALWYAVLSEKCNEEVYRWSEVCGAALTATRSFLQFFPEKSVFPYLRTFPYGILERTRIGEDFYTDFHSNTDFYTIHPISIKSAFSIDLK